MSLTNTSTRYGAVAKTFHWLVALLILTMFPRGLIASALAPEIRAAAAAPDEALVNRTVFLFSLHKTLGVLIFFVALLRILWAISQPRPGLLHPDRKAEAFLAHAIHWILYGSLVLVPLSGWIHNAATTGFAPIWWPFGQGLPFVPVNDTVAEVFAAIHQIFVYVLGGAIVLHVAGALKHHVIDRDATLRRMLPGRTEAQAPEQQAHGPAPLIAALAVWVIALGLGGVAGYFPSRGGAGNETALAAAPSDWTVSEGSLGITVIQAGNPVEGQFADWTAAITFEDPAEPGPAGEVEVTISIPSLTLGSVTQQAMGGDFFDAGNHPTATFKATIEKTALGYTAFGPLTLKDQSVEIALPFTLALDGDTAVMSGSTQVNRLDFSIGQSMPDESSVGFAVAITVNLTATRNAE